MDAAEGGTGSGWARGPGWARWEGQQEGQQGPASALRWVLALVDVVSAPASASGSASSVVERVEAEVVVEVEVEVEAEGRRRGGSAAEVELGRDEGVPVEWGVGRWARGEETLSGPVACSRARAGLTCWHGHGCECVCVCVCGCGCGHGSRGRWPASRGPRRAGSETCSRCSRRADSPGGSRGVAAPSAAGEPGSSGGSAESALLDRAWRNELALPRRFFRSLCLSWAGGGSWVVLEDCGVSPALLLLPSRADEAVEAVDERGGGGSTGEGADDASLLDRAWVRGAAGDDGVV